MINYIRKWIFVPLLFLGVLFPTSIAEVTNIQYYYLAFIFLFCCYLFIPKVSISWNIIAFLLINILLILFTITASTTFPTYSFGIFPSFFLLTLSFFLNLKELNSYKHIQLSFTLISFIIIILGGGIVLQNEIIVNFIKRNYTASYDDLVPNMLALRKPVITFATHSVAALFIFLFFFLNLLTYNKTSKIIYFINSMILLVLLFFIRSNTSIFYCGISIGLFFFYLRKQKGLTLIPIFGILLVFFLILLGNESIKELFLSFNVDNILSSDKNGFSGRYSTQSPLLPTINYILNNPFSPVGLTVSDKLYYSDSGFILYTLRGTIVLTLVIYYSFYRFIKANVINRNLGIVLFLVIIIFEIGYPILINTRFLFLIPFIIVYINYLTVHYEK